MSWRQRCVWALFVGVFLLSLAAVMVAGGVRLDEDFVTLPAILALASIGAWISHRRPDSPIGWLFLAAGSLIALLTWAAEVVGRTQAIGGPWEGTALLALLGLNVLWYVVLSLCVVYVPLLFPDGPLSLRWRRTVQVLAAGQAFCVFLLAASQHLEPTEGVLVANPLAFPTPVIEERFGAVLAAVGILLLPAGVVLGIVSLTLRYRRGGVVERLQLRWFFAAVVLLFLAVVASVVGESLPAGSVVGAVGSALVSLGLVALPVACAVAVLRYRLYEIDRIVSRTVSYLIVTVLVVGTYAVVVTSVTTLLPDSSALAVAGATLVAAALFRPLLRRVQDRVDRAFNRARYDANREVEDYAQGLRDCVDPEEVAAGLLAALDRTLQPAAVGVGVWQWRTS